MVYMWLTDNINKEHETYSSSIDFNNYLYDPEEHYHENSKRFIEIIENILSEFKGGVGFSTRIKLFYDPKRLIVRKSIIGDIYIEGTNRSTTLEYDFSTHEICGGLLWMSLGGRDLLEIAEDEYNIIQRAVLVWIYENII